MRRNIYMDKETEQAYQELRPSLSLSLLVREILTNRDLRLHPTRVVRDVPATDPLHPAAFTLDDPQVVLSGTTVLYEPTIADMDSLGATSVHLEWYDESTDTWRRSE